MSNTLVITNDFPPRPGGIQTFCYELVRRFEPAHVSVLTSNWDGAVEFDAAQKFMTVRANTKTLLPNKRTLAMAREIIVANNVTRVVFGAAAPLGLLASSLRKLGVTNIVSWFFDVMLASRSVWANHTIIEWFEENRPKK
jgi:phosphatidylinositol alpha-1,6-mannosyltransferase